MIRALRKDKELITDILAHEDHEQTHVWWLGQSGYLLQHKGIRVLIDPYLSDSLTKKYANTEKPHVRISERVIDPRDLPRIDIISSSHNHTDHLDAETILPILEKNPACVLIIPEANRNFVANRLSIDPTLPIGLNAGESYEHLGVRFTAIPAAHNELDKDENGNFLYVGYGVEIGDLKIYHSGDTLLYEGMEKWIQTLAPDLALLPINGNDPSRKVAGNLNADEAIQLSLSCSIPLLIPCHYDLFAFNTADIHAFMKKASESKQKYCVMELGGKISSKELLQQQHPN
jgi:L-ascorbate metabolism protein UlaG (beta-lactamase superfamily)